ncbi:unknown [Prevotella sp. CAG:592]|nr:unknown [Prevotella sp. CAG:592]
MIVISLLHWQMAVLNGNIQNIQTIQNRCTD